MSGREGACSVRAVLAAAALFSLLYAVRVYSWDFWWHLATGRWIVEHRAVPAVDPFSYTALGHPWRDVYWLGDLLLFGAWSAGGAAGVVALKVANAFVLLAALGLSFRELGIGAHAVVPVLFAVAALVQPRFSQERPEVFGAVLAAAQIFLSFRYWQGRDGALAVAAAALGIWFLVHASFLVGAAHAAALAAAWAFARRDRRRTLAAAAVALGAASLLAVTSRGRDIVEHAVAYRASSAVVALTQEWTPVRLTDARTWVPAVFLLAGLGGAAVDRRWRPLLLPLAALGAALGTRFQRNVPFGVLLAAPSVALLLDRGARSLARRDMVLAARAVAWSTALLVPGLHGFFVDVFPLVTKLGFSLDESGYPHDTLPALLRLPRGRTLNEFGIGGYLIWHRVPGGVFFDGRTVQVFTDADIRDVYLPILEGSAALDAVADRWDVTYGLVGAWGAEARVMMTAPDWVPVLHGESTTLFVRAGRARPLERAGVPLFPLVRWVADDGWNGPFYAGIARDSRARDELVRQLGLALRRAPRAFVPRAVLGLLAERHPDMAAAVRRPAP